jgi:cyanophycinase-like exopeptidase
VSLLVIMGSGETAPTMVKVHREVIAQSGSGPAVMLDTPFGFQMNADDLVEKTRQYFTDSVGTPVQVARWRRADAPSTEHEKSLALLAQAAWAFAGPGSPTYALRQWAGTAMPEALADVARRGGTLVFGSAAACTLGTHAIPVYEIYKVGEEPHWATGLDLLGRLTGIEAVVVPHYDNAEGGQHDTRFCYLGEQRLAAMETQLPDDVGVLGVDEHTAVVIDLQARTATVRGNARMTLRYRGHSQSYTNGEVLTLDAVADALTGRSAPGSPSDASRSTAAPSDSGGSSDSSSSSDSGSSSGAGGTDGVGDADGPAAVTLDGQIELSRTAFDTAIEAGDVDGCVTAVLALEEAIVAWSADTLQSDASDRARRLLRAQVVRLGELARVGAQDPHDVVRPFVDVLLELRTRARTSKDYATSDLLRDRLTGAGVEVRDTPDGAQWVLSTR